MTEIRIDLKGEQAKLGEVSAADVAQLILGVQKALAQAAAVVLGRPKTTRGRYQATIEQAVRFRLVRIEEGSVGTVLELPEPPPASDVEAFDFDDVATLGQSALDRLLDVVADGKAETANPLIASAVLDVTDKLQVGERYDAIEFDEVPNGNSPHLRRVRIDGAVRARLRVYVDEASALAARPEGLAGVLFEADFERRTAKLRTPTGVVEVSFSEEHDNPIHAALRQNSTVQGEVFYDPRTHIAKTVELRSITRGIEQLAIDPGAFWRELSISDLARQQGSGRPADPESLYDADATEEERNAFMAAMTELD